MQAAMVEDVVDRIKAVRAWVETYIATAEIVTSVPRREVETAEDPKQLGRVSCAQGLQTLLERVVAEAFAQRTLELTDLGLNRRTACFEYRLRLRHVRFEPVQKPQAQYE
jgi:hypothetical protein